MKVSINKEIEQIFKTYFICRKSSRLLTLCECSNEEENIFYRYYRDVEVAYYLLNKKEKQIIDYEYLYKENKPWWKNKYKKGEYEKLKKSTYKKFVKVFYEIHY